MGASSSSAQVLRGGAGGDFHLASKTISRSASGSQHDVDRSLRLLGVDRIDLYQLDDVSTWEEWEQVVAEGGALEGLKAAKARGLIDHIGMSSHSLEVLEAAIGCGELDTVMLEYSAFFPHTRPLISEAARRDVGIIAMRPLGGSGRMSSLRTRMAGVRRRRGPHAGAAAPVRAVGAGRVGGHPRGQVPLQGEAKRRDRLRLPDPGRGGETPVRGGGGPPLHVMELGSISLPASAEA